MSTHPTGDRDPDDRDPDDRDPDDLEQTPADTPAFDIDLDPEDQGLAGSGEEPTG